MRVDESRVRAAFTGPCGIVMEAIAANRRGREGVLVVIPAPPPPPPKPPAVVELTVTARSEETSGHIF